MFSPRYALAFLSGLGLLLSVAFALADEQQDKIRQLISSLGSAKHEVREQASSNLWALGTQAEDALNAATRNEDPEIALRARDILLKLRSGITYNASPELMKIIQEHRELDLEAKAQNLRQIMNNNSNGLNIACALIRGETNVDTRAEICRDIANTFIYAVRIMLTQNRYDAAEESLRILAETTRDERDIYNLKAFHILRGQTNSVTVAVRKKTNYAAAVPENIQTRLQIRTLIANDEPEKALELAISSEFYDDAAFLLYSMCKLDDILKLDRKLAKNPDITVPAIAELADTIKGNTPIDQFGPRDFADIPWHDDTLIEWQNTISAGDDLLRAKKWKEASEAYEKASQMLPPEPTSRYLQGLALAATGDKAGSKALIDLATILPLASEMSRLAMITALTRRGYIDAANQQREIALKTLPPESIDFETIRRQAVQHLAFDTHDYTNAIHLAEESCKSPPLPDSQRSIDFTLTRLFTRASIAEYKALAACAAGNTDQAIAELGKHRYMMMIPALDPKICLRVEALAGKDAADKVFNFIFDELEKLSIKHPRHMATHNNMAWFAACSKRHLKKGLAHAQKAVDKNPSCSAHIDTLAEINFQMGNNAKAIELMQKCIDLDPECGYFKRQLKRFKEGDTNTDPPE